ncbi:hypothetical protein HMPREF0653_00774 [Prevotella disiens JCM 6334 = ATCC 29426]|uniref:Uncharacterized protein n=1 Tax=Prevotella disiens JCM 6334 = ATCC 29426 TaxID=1235811 RepID=A0ABN0NTT4_9BACT|nr:hypothetical protein HMPREF0653_00774 [Prevotella disiens JCM 6334 = ATCC 29426]
MLQFSKINSIFVHKYKNILPNLQTIMQGFQKKEKKKSYFAEKSLYFRSGLIKERATR